MVDLASDLATLARKPFDAISVLEHRRAAARVAEFARSLPRFTLPLVDHTDFERLRLNVMHLVSPQLVKFK